MSDTKGLSNITILIVFTLIILFWLLQRRKILRLCECQYKKSGIVTDTALS